MTTPAAVVSAECVHEHWTARAELIRDYDVNDGPVTAWAVNFTMTCILCGAPMLWLGLPFDALPGRPTVDRTHVTLTLPCWPQPPGVRSS